ncbi:MAG: histidine ammonia-lyase [Clostridiales bacterium]|jgi:histidine ammonia-lyase|nr:histidine ammonia-lyase [Clostridiales bacterium]
MPKDRGIRRITSVMTKMLPIGDAPLTIDTLSRVARNRERVFLSENAIQRMNASRGWIDKILDSNEAVYGVSTGFGELSRIFIPHDKREELQRNLILSHCAGVGDRFPEDVARAIMLLRINSLAAGYSGIRASTVQSLADMLNNDVYPVIPCKGSVGASGDLAPLAHMASVLLGEGSAVVDGREVPGSKALARAGLKPVRLAGKEGLALINGTQAMTAVAALVCFDAKHLMKVSDIAASMSLEALQGTRTAFDPRISMIRAHKGQMTTSKNVLSLTDSSPIIKNHANCEKVQDAYSIRCIPQVHGASKDALRRTLEAVDAEMNAVTDNPIVIPETGEIISGGNFHGQPIALVMDYLKVALSELGNISERRVSRLVDINLSNLPMFLTAYPGVNSGFMILQYTAASLVSENKVLAHPASADSIPTSANQEDHVSMGTIAARQARDILENVKLVMAIEMIAAAQGIDFLSPLSPGVGTAAAHRAIRAVSSHLDEDRVLSPDILSVCGVITDNSLLEAVEGAVGELGVI